MSDYFALTRHDLDIIRGMHRHHLRMYSDTIVVVRVQAGRNLNKRNHGCAVGIEVVLESIWPRIGVQIIP